MAKHVDTIPIEVMILTVDHDIKGTVHVSKYTNTNRELTDLLNDKERRFLRSQMWRFILATQISRPEDTISLKSIWITC